VSKRPTSPFIFVALAFAGAAAACAAGAGFAAIAAGFGASSCVEQADNANINETAATPLPGKKLFMTSSCYATYV
jgi:hypothetical protein